LFLALFKEIKPKSAIRALYDLIPDACFDSIEDEENPSMFVMSLTVDGKEFRAKESSKSKAKVKICKQAIKHLQPETNHYFF
jgi:hypothetical protein